MFKITVCKFDELDTQAQETATQELLDTGANVEELYFYPNGKIAAYTHECEEYIEEI